MTSRARKGLLSCSGYCLLRCTLHKGKRTGYLNIGYWSKYPCHFSVELNFLNLSNTLILSTDFEKARLALSFFNVDYELKFQNTVFYTSILQILLLKLNHIFDF